MKNRGFSRNFGKIVFIYAAFFCFSLSYPSRAEEIEESCSSLANQSFDTKWATLWRSPWLYAFRQIPRASAAERLANIKKLHINTNRFSNITDEQLKLQWNGQTTLTLSGAKESFSKIEGLRRGDKVIVKRSITLTKDRLEELLQTGIATSSMLSATNYDVKLAREYLEKARIDLIYALVSTWRHGFFGVPTAYGPNEWDYSTPLRKISTLDPNDVSYAVVLEYEIPVEAIVVITATAIHDDKVKIPDHVLANPNGFAFLSPFLFSGGGDKDKEITFIDFVPPQWSKSDLTDLRALYDRLSQ